VAERPEAPLLAEEAARQSGQQGVEGLILLKDLLLVLLLASVERR
jgi:hypothetical protein